MDFQWRKPVIEERNVHQAIIVVKCLAIKVVGWCRISRIGDFHMLTGLETALLAGGTALIGASVSAILALVTFGRRTMNGGKNGSKLADHKLDDLKTGQIEIATLLANHMSSLSSSLDGVAASNTAIAVAVNDMAAKQEITNVILNERLPHGGGSK